MTTGAQSRRQVLMGAAAGAMAGVLNRPARAEKAESSDKSAKAGDKGPLPPVLRVSIAAYSFREYLDKPGEKGKMSLFDLVEMAARWGIDAVEPTSYYFFKTDDAYLIQLKRKIFLAGLEISGTPTNNNFCQKPGPELSKSIAHVKEWIDCSAKLGSPTIRVFAGNNSAKLSREENFEHLVPSMKEVAEYAGKHGIFLTLENHGFMTESADNVLRIIDAVGSDWLGVNLDTGNFSEDPYGQMAKLAPRAYSCQIKAAVHDKGKTMPPDLRRIVKILREANYRGYVALEYEGKDPHGEVPVLLKKIQVAIHEAS